MPTTSQQLEDFATRLASESVWTPDLQTELQDLIREPAQTLQGITLPPNDRTKAMDNIYRCAPKGWQRAEQQLHAPTGAVAGFSLWAYDDSLKMDALVKEVGTLGVYKTLALAMIAATARVWAYLLSEHGR